MSKITKAIVWSNVGCSYCEQAKNLLKSKNIEFEERNIAHGTWTVQQLQEAVPGARTVPQIFADDKHIGGFAELKALLDQQGEQDA
jgi:glutaredoxin 3